MRINSRAKGTTVDMDLFGVSGVILNNKTPFVTWNARTTSCFLFMQEFCVESKFQQINIGNLNFNICFRRHFR